MTVTPLATLSPLTTAFTFRTGRKDDAAAVEAMHMRCSEEVLRRRFHSPPPRFTIELLHQLLEPSNGWSVVALNGDTAVGLACAAPLSPTEVEVGLLVEDRHQHQGIGSRLIYEVVQRAAETGYRSAELRTQPDNPAVLATVHRAGLIGRVAWTDGLLNISVPARRNAVVNVDTLTGWQGFASASRDGRTPGGAATSTRAAWYGAASCPTPRSE